MPIFASHPWGGTRIQFVPSQFPHKEIEQAAQRVKPDFHVPHDTLVVVDKEGKHTLAQVPSSHSEHHTFSAKGTDEPALVSVLTQTRDYLKKQPFWKRHSFSDLRSLFRHYKDKSAIP